MRTKTLSDLPGVYASAASCGIKKSGKDLAYIFVPEAVASAGVFTRNKCPAACVQYSKECLKQSVVKAVIVNSGNANAATGKRGWENAKKSAALAAKLLGLKLAEVAVSSTGIIGVQLPMEKLERGLAQLLKNPRKRQGQLAAQAILTTDTKKKLVWVNELIGARRFVVAGMSKGSGMIAPNMATTLSFLVTNVHLSSAELQRMLRQAVQDSFNMISVDTDTSTNDMVLVLANGRPEMKLRSVRENKRFSRLLATACRQLALQVVRDGEGAKKLIEVQVQGARSDKEARKIAMQIASSPLVKTAIHGEDPNWGRVIAAAGKNPAVALELEKLSLAFGPVEVLRNGQPRPFSRIEARQALRGKEVRILLRLKLGKGKATAWGCDLSKRYVEINTDYS